MIVSLFVDPSRFVTTTVAPGCTEPETRTPQEPSFSFVYVAFIYLPVFSSYEGWDSAVIV
ncbi:MAG: hypothetical protein ACYDGM_09665 [Vulcanimicrobiaceae bacterium]